MLVLARIITIVCYFSTHHHQHYKICFPIKLGGRCLILMPLKFPLLGVTTIAGGKSGRGGSHVDGPSEDAKFSDDFDVVYIGSSCSLLVIDRGNRAIREIQLHFDDCAYQYGSGFPLGNLFYLLNVVNNKYVEIHGY